MSKTQPLPKNNLFDRPYYFKSFQTLTHLLPFGNWENSKTLWLCLTNLSSPTLSLPGGSSTQVLSGGHINVVLNIDTCCQINHTESYQNLVIIIFGLLKLTSSVLSRFSSFHLLSNFFSYCRANFFRSFFMS